MSGRCIFSTIVLKLFLPKVLCPSFREFNCFPLCFPNFTFDSSYLDFYIVSALAQLKHNLIMASTQSN